MSIRQASSPDPQAQSVLETIAGKDFSTETTLASTLTQLTSILAKLNDVILVTHDGVNPIPVNVAVADPIPAGTNNIGYVDVLSIAAGTNLIWKVGIDQTTPGTTNGVVEASASAIKTAVEVIDNFISGSRGLVTEDNSGDIKTSVQIMDDWDDSDKCKVQPRDQYGWSADCSPNSELITTDKIKLVGEIFDGAVVDSNFWTATVSTGTVTEANSELILTSGTANGHYARVHTVRRANWVTGTSNKFRTQMRIASSDNDVTLRMGVGWGASMPTVTDGAYFKTD